MQSCVQDFLIQIIDLWIHGILNIMTLSFPFGEGEGGGGGGGAGSLKYMCLW